MHAILLNGTVSTSVSTKSNMLLAAVILVCFSFFFFFRFVSLVPKVEIADGDDQSQVVVSWLLIVLSLAMWVMAFLQCFLEVRKLRHYE